MKSSKLGRDKKRCERYYVEGRRIKNKIIKMTRHLLKNPGDLQGKKRLAEIS